MMGIISTGMVVTSTEKQSSTRLVQPGGREWIAVIQGVNSQGWTVPPFIIVAGQVISQIGFKTALYHEIG